MTSAYPPTPTAGDGAAVAVAAAGAPRTHGPTPLGTVRSPEMHAERPSPSLTAVSAAGPPTVAVAPQPHQHQAQPGQQPPGHYHSLQHHQYPTLAPISHVQSQQPQPQQHQPQYQPLPPPQPHHPHTYPPPPSIQSPESHQSHAYDHHIQHTPTGASHPATAGPPQSGTIPAPGKQTRLRRACDMCSARKVKCDAAGPPCKPCSSLNVECTYMREMKRRGPPNKHAEAARAKRARLEATTSSWSDAAEVHSPDLVPNPEQLPPRPQQDSQPPAQGQAQAEPPALDAESIAPWPLLALLVDDFFTYIHPLIPFPHEPTFRMAFQAREDKTNPEFLALLASMIGCLVASFPRAARLHLKSQRDASMFPRAIVLIERCRDVALLARGPSFYIKDTFTNHDAATSYFLGISAGYTMQWKLCRRFMNECLLFTRELPIHRSKRVVSSSGPGGLEYMTHGSHSVNHIEDQIGKRIFWVAVVGVRSTLQLGASHSEFSLSPPTSAEPYPDYPAEVDDTYITETEIQPQPPGTVSLLTGFNKGIKIYMTMNPLVAVEMCYGINSLSLEEQENMLSNCIHAVKHVTDDLPAELRLNMDAAASSNEEDASGSSVQNGVDAAGIGFQAPVELFEEGYQYFPPAYPNSQPANDVRHMVESRPERRRLIQFEIQKTNIYGSMLATRSFYVERCFSLRDAHRARITYGNGQNDERQTTVSASTNEAVASRDGPPSPSGDSDVWAAERERIVQNLLTVLASIPQRNMEPNGSSFINKIRQVASTLLADAPERKGPLAVKSEATLRHFVDILMRLEKTGGPGNPYDRQPAAMAIEGGDGDFGIGGVMTPRDEEEELRTWADLRECQARFAQGGVFLGGV